MAHVFGHDSMIDELIHDDHYNSINNKILLGIWKKILFYVICSTTPLDIVAAKKQHL